MRLVPNGATSIRFPSNSKLPFMDTKPVLFGLAGLLLGGLSVWFLQPKPSDPIPLVRDATMKEMTQSLQTKSGDEYDAAFIAQMIDHHEGAVAMAKLSADRAKHDEIKQLANEIVTAQETEISLMRQWLQDWGYTSTKHDEH